MGVCVCVCKRTKVGCGELYWCMASVLSVLEAPAGAELTTGLFGSALIFSGALQGERFYLPPFVHPTHGIERQDRPHVQIFHPPEVLHDVTSVELFLVFNLWEFYILSLLNLCDYICPSILKHLGIILFATYSPYPKVDQPQHIWCLNFLT